MNLLEIIVRILIFLQGCWVSRCHGLGLETEIGGLMSLGLVGEGLGLGLVHIVSVSPLVISCLEAFPDLPQFVTN